MPYTEEQYSKLRELINQKRFFLDDVMREMNLPAKNVKTALGHITHWVSIEKCPYCGRSIIIISSNCQQRFCNPEHRKLYYNKHRNKPKASICARCGKEFFQYSFRKSKYCSIQCAALDREESKREKAEKK